MFWLATRKFYLIASTGGRISGHSQKRENSSQLYQNGSIVGFLRSSQRMFGRVAEVLAVLVVDFEELVRFPKCAETDSEKAGRWKGAPHESQFGRLLIAVCPLRCRLLSKSLEP
jgi:hypothetical protein